MFFSGKDWEGEVMEKPKARSIPAQRAETQNESEDETSVRVMHLIPTNHMAGVQASSKTNSPITLQGQAHREQDDL